MLARCSHTWFETSQHMEHVSAVFLSTLQVRASSRTFVILIFLHGRVVGHIAHGGAAKPTAHPPLLSATASATTSVCQRTLASAWPDAFNCKTHNGS